MNKIVLLLILAVSFSASSQIVFLNEIHYDNAGGDVGEFVEVAGTAGVDLAGWSVVLYNGSNGTPYTTINLSGVLPDDGSGGGTLAFLQSGIQNGDPDGFALVDDMGALVEFLSYEGAFAGVGGAADGVMSLDIGVSEISSTTIGDSLQRTDNGSVASPGTWVGAIPNTSGSNNTGQVLPVELINYTVD